MRLDWREIAEKRMRVERKRKGEGEEGSLRTIIK